MAFQRNRRDGLDAEDFLYMGKNKNNEINYKMHSLK